MRKGRAVGVALIAAWALVAGVGCGPDGTEPQESDTVEAMKVAPGGGGSGTYSCQCSDHVGTWTGTYSSQASADADLQVYCRDENGDGNYGTCTAGS